MTKAIEACAKIVLDGRTPAAAMAWGAAARRFLRARFGAGWGSGGWALESLGLVALAAAIEGAAPHVRALGFSLFWVPVALMSAHYGSRAGLFAALAATAASFGLDGAPRPTGYDYYRDAASLAAQPAAWLAYALALGGLRDWHRYRHVAVRDELAQTREGAKRVADGLERSLAEIGALELRIAGERTSLDAVVRALAGLNLDSADALFQSFASLARAAAEAEAVSLFARAGDRLVLRARAGESAGAPPEQTRASALARIAATRAPARLEPPPGACGGAVYAAPICRGADAISHGVLVAHLAGAGDEAQALRRVSRLGLLLGTLLDARPVAAAPQS